ncbi:MAG TPA: glycosyltransferase family 2 protein [Pyrinomonadaceae bacterium]|nr:glycosyltransferase family 2 protein [Pyrinomonadaceae bacterium]
MTTQLSFIIVNWNGGELLRQCIESVARFPPSVPFDIFVVDNASSDDSVKWLKSEGLAAHVPAKLHLIENSENVGFSRANNQAIAESKSDMLFLLNPDTQVTEGAIDTLINTLHLDERIGACGPRLLNPDGSLQHSVWRNPPTPWEILTAGLGLWRLLPKRLRGELLLGGHWDHARRRDVPMLFGAALLARREMIDDVGSLDERFHMYAEDNEWCLRMRRGGWRVVFEPDAEIVHQGSPFSLQRWGTLGKLRAQTESSLDFQRRCLSRIHAIGNLAAGSLVMFFHKIWRTSRSRPREEIQLLLDIYLAGLRQTRSGT